MEPPRSDSNGESNPTARHEAASGAVGAPTLHDALRPLAGLLGTWTGRGSGDYPTIEPFTYHEEVTFGHVGKPFLTYRQRTWHPDTGAPMHAEVGYLRPATADAGEAGPVRVELLLAHPTGIVEVEEGEWHAGRLRLATSVVGLSSTAKPVRSLRRDFSVTADRIVYDLWMAYADVPDTHHLHAELTRQH